MSDALLRAQEHRHLAYRIERHLEALREPGGDPGARFAIPGARGIAVVPWIAAVLRDLVEDEIGRGQVGISDREIEDLPSGRLGLVALPLQLREEVPRQGLKPRAFLDGAHGGTLSGGEKGCQGLRDPGRKFAERGTPAALPRSTALDRKVSLV